MRDFDLGNITAYGDAKKAGFTGSYNDFCNVLARISTGIGVQSYTQLTNKPKINGVELVGNLTNADLGIRTRGSRVEVTTTSPQLYGKTVTLTDGDETMTAKFDNNGKCLFESVLMGGTMIASATANGRTCRSYVQCPYFTNYKTSLTWTEHGVYSFIVDHSGSTISVEYADDANGMVAGSDDWLINEPFDGIKPCLLRNGSVVAYLNKNDYTKDVNGNTVTPQANDDIMVEIPRMGIKSEWIDSDHLKVSITTGKNVSGYDYTAFSAYGTNDSDKLYINANSTNIEVAISTRDVAKPNAIRTAIANGKAKGNGYFVLGFSQYQLIKVLYMLFQKSVVSTSGNAFGMNGILYSNDVLGGIIFPRYSSSDTTYKVMVADCADQFTISMGNNEPTKYVADFQNHTLLGNLSLGFIVKPLGDSKLIFYPDVTSTSYSSSPYGSAAYWRAWQSGYYGGSLQSSVTITGGEYLALNQGTSTSGGYTTHYARARQMYLHTEQ